ncbi:MAG: hypothetical protein OXI75_02915 [Rhodospirillales bacterium]|nr:hypothetical protein [Rhodospirillales bacterium]
MPASVSRDEFAQKTSMGMYKAQKAYEKWSGGLWAWNAPEYLLTTYIAQEISKIKDKPFYLTLEQHVGESLEAAGASEVDVKDTGKQKFDIMVWWGGDAPRGIIEVKKQVNSFDGGATGYGGIRKDVERIIKSLEATSRLQFGLLAYYTSCKFGERPRQSAETRIRNRANSISSGARKFVQEKNMKFKRIDGKIINFRDVTVKDGPNDHAWVAETLMIWGR